MATKRPHPHTDIPEPPRRLLRDDAPLKCAAPSAWDSRRANKMRVRFAGPDYQAAPTMSLIAPVQPPVSGMML